GMEMPKLALLAVGGAAAMALGGCRHVESNVDVETAVSSSPSAPDPESSTEAERSSPPVETPSPAAPATAPGDGCGTVHADSGPSLQVLEVSVSGTDCAEAERLVRELQALVAGQ